MTGENDGGGREDLGSSTVDQFLISIALSPATCAYGHVRCSRVLG
jgi:hypothetical protein